MQRKYGDSLSAEIKPTFSSTFSSSGLLTQFPAESAREASTDEDKDHIVPLEIHEFGPVALPHLSFQALRFSRGTELQRTRGFSFVTRSKGFWGTEVIPVLSQMILAKDARDRALCCDLLKTPEFSNHSLHMSDKEVRRGKDVTKRRLHRTLI